MRMLLQPRGWFVHRGTRVQAEIPSSYLDGFAFRPFAPRSLPASTLLWVGPTPGQGRCSGYVFPQSVGFRHPAGSPRFLD